MRRSRQAIPMIIGLLLALPLSAAPSGSGSSAHSAADSAARSATTPAAEAATPAAPVIEPGLWESTRGGDLEALMAAQLAQAQAELQALPEAQREAVRATMKAQLANLAKPRRSCMSAEQARHFWRDQMIDPSCRRSIRWTAPGRGEMSRQCEQGRTETTAITVVDGKRVTMALSGTTASGQPIGLTMTLRWLGDDCKAIKPR